jgi:von Willebrand factor type A domain/Aerotolerance regulator N-terminal
MSLAFPIALAWAALTVPIVIFYILKIRLRQVPVSTTIFWQQIYDEKRPRSLWQILRHLISLLVQIVWLLLLVFALTEPFFTWEILQARRLILVVDNSASMRATDVTPTRLDAAKLLGRQVISGLRFRDEMTIIAAGVQPQVVCGLTGHERTLQTALAGIEPTDGPTRVTAAIALGQRLVADAKHGRVVVLSDACFPESEKLVDDKLVELRTVGTRVANVGITNFQVRRSLLDPIGYEILIEVTNASDEPVECRLDIDLNDSPADVIPLSLAAGQTWSKAIEKTSVEGGHLVAKLDRPDALMVDNSAIAILPKRTEQRIVLVSEGNLFLRKVLEVNPLVKLEAIATIPKTFEPGVLYVFHKQVPETMPRGNSLVIDPAAGTDLWKLGEKLENPIVTKQDSDSPLMRHVRLDNVLLPEARQLTPVEGAKPLVTALSGEAIYFAIEQPGRKALVLTVNLDQGDLTFRTSFPIMATNALAWFAGQSAELREALASGAVTEVALPASGADILVCQTPSGGKFSLPAGMTKAAIGPLDECGLWQVRKLVNETSARGASKQLDGTQSVPTTAEAPMIELACNLASRTESDLRVPETLFKIQPPTALAASWFARPIWFYLVAAAWLLAAVEWFLYQRRWIS